jgi:hypothetical protein
MDRRRLAVAGFLLLFGILVLMNSLNNPRLHLIHGSDRVQLIASGLCFGVGFGVLMGGRRFTGE